MLLIVGGVIVWFIVHSAAASRQLAEAERRRALALFEIDRSDDTYWDQTRFDFQAMRAHHRWDVMGEPGMRRDTTYALRRQDGGWQWKMSQESWAQHMKELNEMKPTNLLLGPAELAAEKSKYANGPIWEAIPDEHAAPIETAYQRYVRQG